MSGLNWLDRLLPVWIVAAMVLGVLLGSLAPQVRHHMICNMYHTTLRHGM
jgi:ACR3 family arsenite efflux pump ArsB